MVAASKNLVAQHPVPVQQALSLVHKALAANKNLVAAPPSPKVPVQRVAQPVVKPAKALAASKNLVAAPPKPKVPAQLAVQRAVKAKPSSDLIA